MSLLFRRGSIRAFLAAVALVVGVAAGAVSGTVQDEKGRPVAGAWACYMLVNEEKHCVSTDDEGRFELPPSRIDQFRVVAEGYLPRQLPVAELPRTIELEPTPVLLVRFLLGDGDEPVGSEGKLFVIYPTGAKRGPFRVNPVGVRIQRVLEPGEVRLMGEVEGFVAQAQVSATLEAGQETEVTLRFDLNPDPGRP